MGLSEKIQDIRTSSSEEISSSGTLQELEEVRVKYLGRKGALTGVLKSLSSLSADEKRTIGKEANILRGEIENLLDARKTQIENARVAELEHALALGASGGNPVGVRLPPLALDF